MTDHVNGRLWLEVASEPYRVECDCILNAPIETFNASEVFYEISSFVDNTTRIVRQDKIALCPKCQGTSKRTVRLVGLAPCRSGHTDLGFPHKEVYGFDGDGWKVTSTFWDWLGNEVIKAHKAGTLPKSLYQSDTNPHGLREIEVTE
jgi:hypothetical protein